MRRRHGDRCADGNRCIDGVASAAQNVYACFRGERMRRSHHAVTPHDYGPVSFVAIAMRSEHVHDASYCLRARRYARPVAASALFKKSNETSSVSRVWTMPTFILLTTLIFLLRCRSMSQFLL